MADGGNLGFEALGDFILGDEQDQGGAIVTLSSTSAGTSTATSALAVTHTLASTSTGTSTATSTLTRVVTLSSTSAGTSTATSVLTRAIYLSSASAGVSTVTSSLTRIEATLHSTSAGASSVTSSLSRIVGLQSTSAGHSTSVSSLSVTTTHHLHSTSSGSSTASSSLTGGNGTTSITFVTDIGTTPLSPTAFAVAHATLLDIESMQSQLPVLIDMANRSPVYVRSQPVERQISFTIFLLARSVAQRRIDYEAFVNSLDSLSGLVTLRWVSEDGTEKLFDVVPLSISPDAWFNQATAVLIAPAVETKVAA